MEGEARYMRRKVKAGLIEADHDECAIVVHYEIEATVLGESGEAMVAERTVRAPALLPQHGMHGRAERLTALPFRHAMAPGQSAPASQRSRPTASPLRTLPNARC
jgi:cyanophycinase-like exopeptidase